MDRTSTDRIVSTVTVQSTLAVFIAAGDFRIRVCGRPTFVSPMVLQFIIYVSAPNPACVKHCAVDRRLFLGSRLRPRCLYSYINTLFFIARAHAKLYSVSQKITTPLPLQPAVFCIFSQTVDNSKSVFTHLLYLPVYARLQIFIQLSQILTKLCHIKRD